MKMPIRQITILTLTAISFCLMAGNSLAQNNPPDPSKSTYQENYPLGQGLLPPNQTGTNTTNKKPTGVKGFFKKVKDYCTPPDTNPLLNSWQNQDPHRNDPLPNYANNEPGLNTPQSPTTQPRATTYAPIGGGNQLVVGPNGEVSTMMPTGHGGYNVFGSNNSSFSSIQPSAQGGYSVFGNNGQFSQMTPSTGGGYNIWNQGGEQGTLFARPGGGYNVTGTDGSFNTIVPAPGAPNIFQTPSVPGGH